jgi:hypothetical protein
MRMHIAWSCRRSKVAELYQVFCYSNANVYVKWYTKLTDHCYYIGQVNGELKSTAAVSTCSGLR